MSRTVLAIGAWEAFGKLISSAIVNGWSVLHTDKIVDVAAALKQKRADLILMSGCPKDGSWEHIALNAWATREDTPIIALNSVQSQDVLVSALIGSLAPAHGCVTELLLADSRQTHLVTGICGLFRSSRITPTVTLLEPIIGALPADIRRSVEYVDTHYSEPINLANGAQAASYSRCHFCKRFKEHVGMSFVNYLARVRMRHAMELLALSTKSVTEIAFEVGYNDLTHFERVFRTLLRRSPSQFRRSAKDTPEVA